MRPASEAERRRLNETFAALCAIASPSGSERACADAVTAHVRGMGLDVTEDDTRAETGADCGNLLVRIPSRREGAPTILLAAHMDTVAVAGPIEPVVEEGLWINRHEAILGADNKVAVAVLLAVARRLWREPARPGVELLFTTCEEQALAGAKALDRSRLRASYGFVFDHASPVGELIVAAPTYYRIEARFHGVAAHAGIRPEDGRNAIEAAARAIAAMPLGRIDPETTANAGRIEGGTAGNVVAERCRVELEARSLDDERAGSLVGELVDAASEAASGLECDLDTVVERQFQGYRMPRTAAPVEAAARALEQQGIEPVYRTTGGGSDANALIAAGLPVLNVANGTEANHQPDERVTVEALEKMLDVTLGIVAASAR